MANSRATSPIHATISPRAATGPTAAEAAVLWSSQQQRETRRAPTHWMASRTNGDLSARHRGVPDRPGDGAQRRGSYSAAALVFHCVEMLERIWTWGP